MSDTSQGPGWWMASDGKWYPPETHPSRPPPPPAPPAGPMMYAPPEPAKPTPTAAASPLLDAAAKRRRSAGYVVGAAAALMVCASFLPWVKVNFFVSIARSGIDGGDGWISVILGGLLAIVAWRLVKAAAEGARAPVVLAILLSIAALGLAIFEWVDIENTAADVGSDTGPFGDEIDLGAFITKGIGLYALGLAGVVGVGGAIAYIRPPQRR